VGTSSLASGVNPTVVLSAAAVASVTGCDDPLATVLIETPELTAVLRRSAALIDEVPAMAAAHHLIADYQAARNRRFDAFLSDAVRNGLRQCVILGAGLDTRSYRLPWLDGVTVFEVDRPRVLRFKVATLADHGASPHAELRCAGVDYGMSWPQALWRAGFNHNEPTAWIAEGLLPLPDHAQDAMVSEVDGLSAAGSRVAYDDVLGRCSGRSDASDWLTSRGWWTDVVDARTLPELAGRRAEMSDHAVLVTAEKIA